MILLVSALEPGPSVSPNYCRGLPSRSQLRNSLSSCLLLVKFQEKNFQSVSKFDLRSYEVSVIVSCVSKTSIFHASILVNDYNTRKFMQQILIISYLNPQHPLFFQYQSPLQLLFHLARSEIRSQTYWTVSEQFQRKLEL